MLNVPNTKDARLAKSLIRGESKLAKMTKYNVKIVKKSGIQLCRLFQRLYSPARCYWEGCPVCVYSDGKKSSKCRVANVVYEARCIDCQDLVSSGQILEKDVGVYVGETSRTLMERATEHVNGAENIDLDNFITKHWAHSHSSNSECPKMKFKVLKQCKDALTRQVVEAVLIESKANLNSKSEWGRNSLTRLRVDSGWKVDDTADVWEKNDEDFLLDFKKKKKKTSPQTQAGCSRATLNL